MDMITASQALPGRDDIMPLSNKHYVLDVPIKGDFDNQYEQLVLALGCFWGAEKLFWNLPGVYTTAVGYAGGFTPNPTYEEVCSGRTGHTEVVLVVYDSSKITLDELMTIFWQAHDPTQGMRQGNDRGTQYRSAVYTSSREDLSRVLESMAHYQDKLTQSGYGAITTEVKDSIMFYYAEEYHQQYLGKNPGGYCGLSGTGVKF